MPTILIINERFRSFAGFAAFLWVVGFWTKEATSLWETVIFWHFKDKKMNQLISRIIGRSQGLSCLRLQPLKVELFGLEGLRVRQEGLSDPPAVCSSRDGGLWFECFCLPYLCFHCVSVCVDHLSTPVKAPVWPPLWNDVLTACSLYTFSMSQQNLLVLRNSSKCSPFPEYFNTNMENTEQWMTRVTRAFTLKYVWLEWK